MTDFNIKQVNSKHFVKIDKLEFEPIEIPFQAQIKLMSQNINVIKNLIAGTDNTIWLSNAQDNINDVLESWKNKK